jgi:hypothetical protein
VKNARKVPWGSEGEPEDSNETVAVDPGRRLWVFTVNGGKALTGSGGLVGGQDVMKDAAKVKTSFKSNATSNEPLAGLTLFTAEAIKAAWRASVERMTAAVVRRDLSEMSLAAPAYADTPVPSRAWARAAKDLGSLKGKLYSHGWVAWLPRTCVKRVSWPFSS